MGAGSSAFAVASIDLFLLDVIASRARCAQFSRLLFLFSHSRLPQKPVITSPESERDRETRPLQGGLRFILRLCKKRNKIATLRLLDIFEAPLDIGDIMTHGRRTSGCGKAMFIFLM